MVYPIGEVSEMKTPNDNSVSTGLLAAIPWCCILPAVFSALGLGGVVAARLFTTRLTPLLFVISVLFLGRAFFLVYWKGQGNRFSRISTGIAAVVVSLLWLPRLWVVVQ